MSNTHRPARSIARRLGLLAATAGILTTSLAVGSGASAQTPDDFGGKFPGAPIPIPKPIPTDPIIIKDIKLPKIPKAPRIPLPCFGWWCDVPLTPVALPDYVSSFDAISAVNGWYEGEKAVPYYVKVNNIGNADPGAVWTTLASPNGEILAVEPVGTWRTEIVAQPVSWTARWTAPLATEFLDGAWVVQDTNGIPAGSGYAEMVYVRVWMAGWDRPELIVSANDHVGVEELGALIPFEPYRHDEVTRDNNRISFSL